MDFTPEPVNFKKKKKKGKAKPKVSPYRQFTDWLLNAMPSAKLSEDVIRAINPRSALCLFGNLGGITIFLNERFNTFNIMKLPPLELYNFLRVIVQIHKIKRNEFSFYASEKSNKSLTEIHTRFPLLKRYEVHNFLQLVEVDPEYEALMDNLGIKKYKKSKITKKEQKEIAKKKKAIPKTVSTFKNGNTEIQTFDQLAEAIHG